MRNVLGLHVWVQIKLSSTGLWAFSVNKSWILIRAIRSNSALNTVAVQWFPRSCVSWLSENIVHSDFGAENTNIEVYYRRRKVFKKKWKFLDIEWLLLRFTGQWHIPISDFYFNQDRHMVWLSRWIILPLFNILSYNISR